MKRRPLPASGRELACTGTSKCRLFIRPGKNRFSLLPPLRLDDRDRDGVWHPHKGMSVARSANSHVWPVYPLEESLSGDERWTDVTFRLGVIARVIGRTIEIA